MLKFKKNYSILILATIMGISSLFLFGSSNSYAEDVILNSSSVKDNVIMDELESFPIEDEEIVFDISNTYNSNIHMFSSSRTASTKVSDYFISVSWIKRNGIWSLSLRPKNNLRYTPGPHTVTSKLAWGTIWRDYAGDKRWNYKNKDSMRRQFDCHVSNAKFKSYWNLEPSRSSSSPIHCN